MLPALVMLHRVRLVTAALLVGYSPVAHAAASGSSPFALELDQQLGWLEGQHSGGIDAGVTVRLRYSVLTAGLNLQGATTLLNSMGVVGTVAGLSVPLEFLRLDTFAALGFNGYTRVGANFLSDDPGAGAVLPFAGVHSALLARVVRNGRGITVWVGPCIEYAKDLSSTARTYTYREQHQDWFDGSYTDELVTRTVHIGQTRFSVLLTTSISFPL